MCLIYVQNYRKGLKPVLMHVQPELALGTHKIEAAIELRCILVLVLGWEGRSASFRLGSSHS